MDVKDFLIPVMMGMVMSLVVSVEPYQLRDMWRRGYGRKRVRRWLRICVFQVDMRL